MGVYLNPGNDLFEEAVSAEIYVDKTELISCTNKYIRTPQKYICISRPRRFGKSMAAYMLAAYYGKECDSSELFAPYKIARDENYKKHLNRYNVIMLRGEFCNAIVGERWKNVVDALEQSDRLLQATWNQDSETVAEILDAVHSENTSILTYNDENSLSCVISIAYYNAMTEYTKVREFPTGKGFADIVYLPKKHSDKPAMIVELKYDKSAEGAIAQIKDKKYVESLKEYDGNLLLVGINYDKESKKHTCVIEKSSASFFS